MGLMRELDLDTNGNGWVMCLLEDAGSRRASHVCKWRRYEDLDM